MSRSISSAITASTEWRPQRKAAFSPRVDIGGRVEHSIRRWRKQFARRSAT
jgi:hypothetical protein